MEYLNHIMALAQVMPAPVDISDIVKLGPGYAFAGYMLWLWGKERDRGDKLIEAHKAELAAERARSDQITDKRLEDQKIIIPLASALTVAAERTATLMEKIGSK